MLFCSTTAQQDQERKLVVFCFVIFSNYLCYALKHPISIMSISFGHTSKKYTISNVLNIKKQT